VAATPASPQPSAREKALKRGADELMNQAEYTLREEKRALARVKRVYVKFCLLAYRAIERAAKVSR
jgi:hypothetical protein